MHFIIYGIDMKNIAFVITKSIIGGAQGWVLEQVKLLKDDCKIILIALSASL